MLRDKIRTSQPASFKSQSARCKMLMFPLVQMGLFPISSMHFSVFSDIFPIYSDCMFQLYPEKA